MHSCAVEKGVVAYRLASSISSDYIWWHLERKKLMKWLRQWKSITFPFNRTDKPPSGPVIRREEGVIWWAKKFSSVLLSLFLKQFRQYQYGCLVSIQTKRHVLLNQIIITWQWMHCVEWFIQSAADVNICWFQHVYFGGLYQCQLTRIGSLIKLLICSNVPTANDVLVPETLLKKNKSCAKAAEAAAAKKAELRKASIMSFDLIPWFKQNRNCTQM